MLTKTRAPTTATYFEECPEDQGRWWSERLFAGQLGSTADILGQQRQNQVHSEQSTKGAEGIQNPIPKGMLEGMWDV